MSERTDADLIREARARAFWVRDWWFANKWLGVKGAVPEVRNLCDDVSELTAALDRHVAERDRLAEAIETYRREFSALDHPETRRDKVVALVAALARTAGTQERARSFVDDLPEEIELDA